MANEQLGPQERFRREKLWKAKRDANIPEPWNVSQTRLERVQRATYVLAVRDVIEVLTAELGHQAAARSIEEIFKQRGIFEPPPSYE